MDPKSTCCSVRHDSVESFVCPECRLPIHEGVTGYVCEVCNLAFPVTCCDQADLRPQRTFVRPVEFRVGDDDPVWSSSATFPPVTVRELARRRRQGVRALIPRAATEEQAAPRALEVGCGSKGLRAEVETAGYVYTGCDFTEQAGDATVLCDIHALPFADGHFSLVICKATLEHVRYPHVAAAELARVLCPGGILIGDVAFLQPYHQSYYHMSHAAANDLLAFAGLSVNDCHRGQGALFSYLAGQSDLPQPLRQILSLGGGMADMALAAFHATKQIVLGRNDDPLVRCSVGIMFSASKPTRHASSSSE